MRPRLLDPEALEARRTIRLTPSMDAEVTRVVGEDRDASDFIRRCIARGLENPDIILGRKLKKARKAANSNTAGLWTVAETTVAEILVDQLRRAGGLYNQEVRAGNRLALVAEDSGLEQSNLDGLVKSAGKAGAKVEACIDEIRAFFTDLNRRLKQQRKQKRA